LPPGAVSIFLTSSAPEKSLLSQYLSVSIIFLPALLMVCERTFQIKEEII